MNSVQKLVQRSREQCVSRLTHCRLPCSSRKSGPHWMCHERVGLICWRENGTNDREGSLYNLQPAFIGLISLHQAENVWQGSRPGWHPATSTDVLVGTVRAQVERVLSLHPQPSPYGTQSAYPLENTLKQLTQESDRATVENLLKVHQVGMEGTARIVEEEVLKEMAIYLHANPGNRADFRYTGDERQDIDEDCRGRRYRQKKKSNRKYRGGRSTQKKYSDPSDSDESDSEDERGDEPNRKKRPSHRCKTMDRR